MSECDSMEYFQFIWMYDRLNKYKLENRPKKNVPLMDMLNGQH